MKYVRFGLEKPRPSANPYEIFGIVDFFYSDRGGEAQRGHHYMLRSILYQLLAPGIKGRWECCHEVYSEFKRQHSNPSSSVPADMDFDTLKTMFIHLINYIDQPTPTILYILVDAMDESEKHKRKEILDLFTGFCGSVRNPKLNLKILVASRPDAEVGVAFKDHLSFKLEEETKDDIWRYVYSETRKICEAMGNITMDQLQFVVDYLIVHSRGVFLWVKLVIQELEENALAGCSLATIEELLRSLPLELDTLYARIMARTGEQQATYRKKEQRPIPRNVLLHWVMYSERPLTLAEIEEVMAVEECGKNLCQSELDRHKTTNADRRLLTLCGGLLEVKNGIVQFIHQTVRDFLGNLPDKSRVFLSGATSEEPIASTCTRYIRFMNDTVQARQVNTMNSANDHHWLIPFFENCHLFHYAMHLNSHAGPMREISADLGTGGMDRTRAQVARTLERAFEGAINTGDLTAVKRILRVVAGQRETCMSELGPSVHDGSRDKLSSFAGGSKRDSAAARSHTNSILSLENGLHLAAEHGHEAIVQLLLSEGAVLDATTSSNETALHLAAENGHEATVLVLLDRGATIEAKTQSGSQTAITALHLAAWNGHQAIVRLLLDRGAAIEETTDSEAGHRYTALHLAAQNGHEATVWVLLEQGALIETRTHRGNYTALHLAASNGHPAIVQILLNAGAVLDVTTSSNKTALHLAAENGHEAALLVLLHKGASIEATIDYETGHRYTALHLAALDGREAIVRLLLDYGAAIEATTSHNETALHLAARNGHQAVVRVLHGQGALIGVRTHRGSHTALHLASQGGHAATVRLLLDCGAAIEATTSHNETALHLAAQNGHEAALSVLLHKGAFIEATIDSEMGHRYTALHMAAQNGQEAIMQLLLDHGADIEATTQNGYRALHLAAQDGHEATVQVLLDKGALIEARTQRGGYTALQLATRNGHHATVRLLHSVNFERLQDVFFNNVSQFLSHSE
jgi:ankyrin repeat protein